MYVFVRRDLLPADQMVQVGHVCAEAGAAFHPPCACRLILLSVEDEADLIRSVEICRARGIRLLTFYEPDTIFETSDVPMGRTAAATEPISGAQRKFLRRFRLWR